MTSPMTVLNWLRLGVASIALLNLGTLVSLAVAYAWRHRLKSRFGHRGAPHSAFERRMPQPSPDNHSTIREASRVGDWWEW
jgi:alkylation response protein AidB-like acyl-CoA dehydrogenase